VDRHGKLHLPFQGALKLAQAFAASEPDTVLFYLSAEEKRWEEECRKKGEPISTVDLVQKWRAAWMLAIGQDAGQVIEWCETDATAGADQYRIVLTTRCSSFRPLCVLDNGVNIDGLDLTTASPTRGSLTLNQQSEIEGIERLKNESDFCPRLASLDLKNPPSINAYLLGQFGLIELLGFPLVANQCADVFCCADLHSHPRVTDRSHSSIVTDRSQTEYVIVRSHGVM
jgi:hypothetical protein